ncbi:MAG: type III pantothenate kinase [Phycisphaerae bacterium]|jgi:type III pantothenate kinase
MSDQRKAPDAESAAIVVDIGNTTTSIATWQKGELKTPLNAPTPDRVAVAKAVEAHAAALPGRRPRAVVVGSVVPEALQHFAEYIGRTFDQNALIVGETIGLPIEVQVKDAKALGADRACAAAAAYDKLQAGCTIVDFGSATTVDLVDDQGVLLGGAILPGASMQLAALNEHTAALPRVQAGFPASPYGRDTEEAMQIGVCRGLAGAVRGLVESYASHLNRWPQVVATGGDLALLAPHCDFLDTLVEHLTLRGVGLALTIHLEGMGA